MKKLIAFIMIIAMLLPAAVSAEDLFEKKLGDLTFDELMLINKNIQIRLFKKEAAVDGVKVPAGEYIVGEDIPAGTYRIEYRPMTDYSFCMFTAYNEETWLSFYTQLGFDSSTEIGKLELPRDTHISITGGDLYFYTYTGLFTDR